MTLTISEGEDTGDDDDDNGDNGDDNGNQGDYVTVFWDNSKAKWSKPYVHYWGGTGSTWPGVAMTKVGGDIWRFDCPQGTTGCIFNAGDGDATKTGDFVAIHNHYYTSSGDKGSLVPDKLYVLGNLPSGSWSTSDGIELTKSGDKFVAHNVELVASSSTSNNAYFNLASSLGSSWDDVNKANRFGAETTDAPLTVGSSAPMALFKANENASSCSAWKITPGKYTITADIPSMKVLVTKPTTSIEDLEATTPDEAPVYYNLQGVRVDNPGPGLYIRVQSGRATKIRL